MKKKSIHTLLNEYNLVVPEIQREYVWGNNKPIVETFIGDIISSLEAGEANIGFLYSYKDGDEYHIIDGQQRFTTILLLLHFISSRDNGLHNEFIKLLHLDDTLPAFAYRVRATTVSFMKSLFASRLTDVKDIREQKWFKLAYDNDVTISALLGTINTFNGIVGLCDLDFHKMLDGVTFWYFAVDQTSQGEELYITMNSRGEKLADNEQLKPRLFAKLKDHKEKEYYGKQWDNWEEFFYAHRNVGKKKRDIKSVDTALNNVMRVALELKTNTEHNTIKTGKDESLIEITDIEEYIDSLIYIFKMDKPELSHEIDRLYGDSDTDQNFFVLKALLTERIKGQKNLIEFERVYHTIKNQVLRGTIKSHKDFLSFLSSYKAASKRFYDFAIEDARLFDEDELDKIAICNDQGYETERELWGVQETKFWAGDIRPMISWAKKNGVFMLDEFVRIHDRFRKFFNEDQQTDCTSDLARRALLCIDLNNYPINATNFGYTNKEWINIFIENEGKMKHFFYESEHFETIEAYCNNIIAHHDCHKEWAEFVEEPELLEYLNTKHIYWNENFGHILVKNNWAQPLAVKAMHIYLILKKSCSDILGDTKEGEKWQLWTYKNRNHPCAVIDNDEFSLDILYRRTGNGGHSYQVQLFKRDEKVDTEKELSEIAKRFCFKYDSEIGRYSIMIPFDDSKVIDLIRGLYKQEYNLKK